MLYDVLQSHDVWIYGYDGLRSYELYEENDEMLSMDEEMLPLNDELWNEYEPEYGL